MEIKHQVVILPTEKASKVWIQNDTSILHYANIEGNNCKEHSNQHLYILSDEEIKEGDWVTDSILQPIKLTRSHIDLLEDDSETKETCKKIIATTNPELHEISNSAPGFNFPDKLGLPQIPQSFLPIYIKAYNEGNPIKEVMVEYDFEGKEILTPNPNNTIIIKEIKEKKYSREEVLTILEEFNDAWRDRPIYEDDENPPIVDKWFDKNYPE